MLEIEKEEEMGWTRYSEGDALRICVLARLVSAGIDLRLAGRVVQGLTDYKVFKELAAGALYVTVSGIREVTNSRGDSFGFAFQQVWHPTRNRPAKFKSDDESVAIVVDVARIYRAAQQALKAAT